MEMTRSSHLGTGKCSVKKLLFLASYLYRGHWLICSGQESYSHRRLFFFIVQFISDKTGSLSQEFRCSFARSKFRTGVLSTIFNCSTERLDLPVHCKFPSASSSKIRKNTIFSQEATKHHKKYLDIPEK